MLKRLLILTIVSLMLVAGGRFACGVIEAAG